MGFESSCLPFDECLEAIIDYRGRTPRKAQSGVPLITAKIVKTGRIGKPSEFIAESDFDGWMTRGLPELGDVVLTTEAPLGEVGQIKRLPAALAQRVVALRGRANVLENSYLLYALQTEPLQSDIRGRATGTTVLGIKQSELRKVVIAVPKVSTQRAIAGVLKSLDDRIDYNRALAAKLEAIARTLFKSWFVDFDPVRAKAAGQAPAGMDEDLAKLFPDRLVDSEIGEVPEGWAVQPIGHAFEINPRRTLRKGSAASYLDMANTPTSGHVPAQVAAREFKSGTKFLNGDTLLARITPCLENGKSAFIDFLEPDEIGWGSTEFIVLRPKAPLPCYFGYLLCRYEPFKAFAVSTMSGTSGRQRVQNDALSAWQVAVPTSEVGKAFGELIEPLRRSIALRAQENRCLVELRGLLLPRLISGKLRIADVEAMVAAS